MKKIPFTIFTSLAIVVLSLAPLPDNPPLESVPFIDKWVHFVMYGGLVLACWLDCRLYRTERGYGSDEKSKSGTTADMGRNVRHVFVFFLYASFLGGLMELAQSLTSYRSGDIVDFYADVFGAGLMGLILLLVCLKVGSKN